MSKSKSSFKVTVLSPTGKREEITVDANHMVLLDGIEDSLLCFNNTNETVFAIPFRNFVSAQKVAANQPTKQAAPLRRLK